MMVEAMRSERLRLLQVVREQLSVRGLFVLYLVARKQVVQAAVKDMCPVERLGDFPGHAMKRWRDLLLVGRDWWGAEDEVDHFQPCLLDPFAVLRLEERLGEMRMTEVDAVELAVELRQITHHRVLPRATRLPSMVARHPVAEPDSARLRMLANRRVQLWMLAGDMRSRVSGERVLIGHHGPPIVDGQV